MPNIYRLRRFITVVILLLSVGSIVAFNIFSSSEAPDKSSTIIKQSSSDLALAVDALKGIPIKGRAPKTDYSREQFGSGWTAKDGCDTRNIILNRDLLDVQLDESCHVTRGVLRDPYTGKTIQFVRGSSTSVDVQIDHVVALSDAWQKGAQLLTRDQRIALANDPLELLAVDGGANQQKSDGDAATWLPPYKPFRCQYVSRQIAVKQKYQLWVTQAEKDAMTQILASCPLQTLPAK
jgi:hypothetical protein